MNEKLDLVEILKDCPKGTELWSDDYGKVEFSHIDKRFDHPIITKRSDGHYTSYSREGWFSIDFPANCLLWPSRDCRDWSKFTAPWHKKEKFDPKTLKPFDRVLVRNNCDSTWRCAIFSHISDVYACQYIASCACFKCCIPYNDETKHLIGTTEDAPEYYKYWEELHLEKGLSIKILNLED